MSLRDSISYAIDGMRDYSYQKASASGGIVGILVEFAQARGAEIAFLFLAGAVGAFGGAFGKWIVSKIPKPKVEEKK